MKKSVIIGFMCCVAVIGIAATSWAADQEKPKTPEESTWEEVNSLDKQSLQDFLKRFPDGELAKQAKVAKELQDRFSEIKEGKTKRFFRISLDQLSDTWKGWQKRNPSKGVIGYYTKKGEKYNTLGWFKPGPLSGGKTPGLNTISFDSRGLMTSPTGEGSIIAFRTGGLKFQLFNDIVFQTPGDEPIYFGVLEGKGLVHLKGAGKVTLPDGKTTEINLSDSNSTDIAELAATVSVRDLTMSAVSDGSRWVNKVTGGTGTIKNKKGNIVAEGRLSTVEGILSLVGKKGTSFKYVPQIKRVSGKDKVGSVIWSEEGPTKFSRVSFGRGGNWTLKDDGFHFLIGPMPMLHDPEFSIDLMVSESLVRATIIELPIGEHVMFGYKINALQDGATVTFAHGSITEQTNCKVTEIESKGG